MKYRSLAALGIWITLVGGRARAEEDDAPVRHRKAGAAPVADTEDDEAAQAAPPPKQKPVVQTQEQEASPPPQETPVSPPTELGPPPERPPIYGSRSSWSITPYGYARLDAIEDSTQSFADGIQPNLIARPGTYKGDHPRSLLTAKDSRLGVFVGAPSYRGIRSFAQIELDFYGLTPTDARRNDVVIFATPRIRQAYLKLETAIVDVVAGQYYDLFGWGPYFYPATVAYLGVPGEIYHRNPQLRLEKKIRGGDVEILLAVAAVKGGEGDSGVPDGQAGLKLSYFGWKGAANPGFGRPGLQPVSIGVSGVYRHFQTPVFRAEPGSEAVTTNGYGLAASLLLPVIPIKDIKDRGNALTLSGEFTTGSGIADLYTGMDGGSRFPLLPNPNLAVPAIQYLTTVDPGLVTFDRNLDLKTINWRAVVANAQYYLPIDHGRAWIEGTYSRIWSNNIKDLTPFPSWGGIFTKMEYFDANLGIDITPSLVFAISFQSVQQTFGDETANTPNFGQIAGASLGVGASGQPLSISGTGGANPTARNNRGQLSMALFF